MKILIGTYEIAGLIQQYKSGFELLGHTVTTAVFEKVSWYDCEYNHILNDRYLKGRDNRKLNTFQYFHRTIRKINNKRSDWSYRRYIFNLIDQHDIIVIFWHPFINTYDEYQYIKRKGKQLVCIFVGSDARYFLSFKQEFDISHFSFPESFENSNIDYHIEFVRNAEKFADVIYSLPDQAGLQLRPYRHLQIPFDFNKAIFNNCKRTVPKILHAPSIPYKKGTDVIENTLNRIRGEGFQFEFISIRDMKHSEVLKLLADADILIDEIVYHGPGVLSFEAMASGCAVATRYLEDSPVCFRPPVWSINADNIYERIKELLVNVDLQQHLIKEGRSYIVNNNSAEKVALDILDQLQNGNKPNYFPKFFRMNFIPLNKNEILQINRWTEYVSDCEWYKACVPNGERDGLKF